MPKITHATNTLSPLGLSPSDERVYRQVLNSRGGSARTIARVLRTPAADTEQRLQRLLALGLISRTNTDMPAYVPGGGLQPSGTGEVHYVANPPAATLGAILQARATALITAGAGIEELTTLYLGRGISTSTSGPLLHVVEGVAAVNEAVFELLSSSRSHILNLDRPPFVSAERPRAIQPAMFDALGRGVHVRTIYAGDVFRVAGYNEYMTQATALGEHARLATHLPIRFMIVDGTSVLFPIAVEGPWISAAAIAGGNVLVEDLALVFEDLWNRATPLSVPDEGERDTGFDGPELVLLRMLSTDITEAAIGRHLGASARTVGRRLAQLQHKLGAQTRFGMGVEAARRGLL